MDRVVGAGRCYCFFAHMRRRGRLESRAGRHSAFADHRVEDEKEGTAAERNTHLQSIDRIHGVQMEEVPGDMLDSQALYVLHRRMLIGVVARELDLSLDNLVVGVDAAVEVFADFQQDYRGRCSGFYFAALLWRKERMEGAIDRIHLHLRTRCHRKDFRFGPWIVAIARIVVAGTVEVVKGDA